MCNCVTCIVSNRKLDKKEGLYTSFYTYQVDFFGSLDSTNKLYRHMFAEIDSFMNFAWLYPSQTTSVHEAISRLKIQSSTFGNPVALIYSTQWLVFFGIR